MQCNYRKISLLRRRTEGLVVRRIDSELLVLDDHSNQIHSLNETAALIWEHVDGCDSVEELSRLLVDRFHVDGHTALRDALATVNQLTSAGLLVPVPTDSR